MKGAGVFEPKIVVGGASVYHGSCLDVLPFLADCSVDSIVCDPPYELGFMGKKWDTSGIAFNVEVWEQCLRVLKPGGHLLAFGGSRTWHRLAVAIEDAGFEVRDSIAWLYGSGFPKSLDVSKAIDKAAGVEREVVTETVSDLFGEREERKEKPAFRIGQNGDAFGGHAEGAMFRELGDPVTDEAKQWQGWGTALKPAFEPVVVARKPLIGTVAANVLEYGTGGLNIDGTRIAGESWGTRPPSNSDGVFENGLKPVEKESHVQGRWPSNVMLDEYTAALLDEQSGNRPSAGEYKKPKTLNVAGKAVFDGGWKALKQNNNYANEQGGASRFFYVAKASNRDRNEGLDELPDAVLTGRDPGQDAMQNAYKLRSKMTKNIHPTVKPTDLMRQLVRLVTPPGGIVLDPFTGSGSTGKAALLEGFKFIGIELTEDYLPIIQGRLQFAVDAVDAEMKARIEQENERLF